MNKLPIEVYQNIFTFLPRETILQCTLVCRKWTMTVRECLHSHVSIEAKDKLDKFMDYITADASRRKQVKSFRLFIKPLHQFDKRSVCDLFPNLHQVEFIQFEGDTSLLDLSSKEIDTTTMTSTIEKVVENGDYHFILHLIESNLCERLRTLYIRYLSKSQPSVIHQLKNMPVLQTLTLILDDFIFTFEDLDRLHQEIPSLIELHIGEIILVKNRMPVNTRSMPLINKMGLNLMCTTSSADLTEAYLQYFQYVSMKYPNLEELAMSVIGSAEFTKDDKKRVLDFGWMPLLQSLGPQLKSIENIDVIPDVNIFKELDDLGCTIEKLSVYPDQCSLALADFVQSNQSRYMRDLYMANVALQPGDCLKETRLVKLTLYDIDNEEPFVLNHFLKICPDTLKYLHLESCDMEYDESDDFQCLSLVSLEINSMYDGGIGSGVRENVYRCCPNLTELRIEDFY